MFIAALFTIAKLWKQPKCPSIDEWIKKRLYLYVHLYLYINKMKYYMAIKKNKVLPYAITWIDLECIMLSNKSFIKRQIVYDFTHMWNLRNKTNE